MEHVLRMPAERILRYRLFFEAGNESRMVQRGRKMTWVKSLEALFNGLARVSAARPPSWGPQDSSKEWLERMGDMAQCRSP